MSDEQARELVTVPATEVVDIDGLAEQLVSSAAQRQGSLTGEDGLLTALTRRVLQAALEAEMSAHLGYDKHEPAGRDGGNSRNSSSPKTVRTEIGDVTIAVPRDRAGTFEPQIVPRRTVVTNPADPAAFPAGKGVFAEFNVPTKSLFPAGKPEWSVIPGPNVGNSRFGRPLVRCRRQHALWRCVDDDPPHDPRFVGRIQLERPRAARPSLVLLRACWD